MHKMILKFSAVVLLMTVTVSCAKEAEADFVGYVVHKSNDNITIVEASDRMPPIVYLNSSTQYQVGSKVEVRFKDEAMHTAFPSTGRADISEITISVREKDVLEQLFHFITDQNGPNYYTSISSIIEQEGDWIIQTREFMFTEEVYQVSYHVSGDSLDITITDKIRTGGVEEIS